MFTAPFRVLQTSSTTGFDPYILDIATQEWRNFRDQYADGTNVPFVATDGVTDFEFGLGTLAYSSPDSITRNVVIASSNNGNAVNWPAGSRTIYSFDASGSCYLIPFTASFSLEYDAWGSTIIYIGTSIAQNVALPALNYVPTGWSATFKNSGSAAFNVAAHGDDVIEDRVAPAVVQIPVGGSIKFCSDGIVWREANIDFGARLVLSSQSADYTIQDYENGKIFDNVGASTPITFTLPIASPGMEYGFTVINGLRMTITPGDDLTAISIGENFSITGGTIAADTPFAHITLYAASSSYWVARSSTGTWTVT